MGGRQIGGKDIDIMLGTLMIHVLTFSLSVTHNIATTQGKGRPNGWVSGDASAEGEIEVDTENYNLIWEVARRAGCFEHMEEFDIVANAETTRSKFNLEAFGCKLIVTDLLNSDSKGGEVLKHKLKYLVTGEDFINVNGVPYLEQVSSI